MNNPCKECIVTSMCSVDCLLLRKFIFKEVDKYDIPISLMKSLKQTEIFKDNTITIGWEGNTKGIIIRDGEVSIYIHSEIHKWLKPSTSFSWKKGRTT